MRISDWSSDVCSSDLSIFALTPAEREGGNDATVVERRREMGLLGITALRPGRNGMDMSAPNAVNYDEAKAEPRPIVSDVLAGAATADAWWHERRPALGGNFEKEMYGRVPANLPAVTWRVASVEHDAIGGVGAAARHVIGQDRKRGGSGKRGGGR